MNRPIKKAGSLVLLALLATPGLRLEAGGSFSSCRKQARTALPAAALLCLLASAQALNAKPLEGPVPAAGDDASGASDSAALTAAAEPEAPARGPYVSLPEQGEKARLPEALRRLAGIPVKDLVERAWKVYRPDPGSAAPPKEPGRSWRGRDLARAVLKDYRSSNTPSDWQGIRAEVDDLASPGRVEAYLASTRQLVTEFEDFIGAALESHQASKASDRDQKLFRALDQARTVLAEEIDLAGVYISNMGEILFERALKAQTQDLGVLLERQGKAIYHCSLLLDGAQERYKHYIALLRRRVLPDGHYALLETEEFFHRHRHSIASLMEHGLRWLAEDEYGDEVRAHGTFQ